MPVLLGILVVLLIVFVLVGWVIANVIGAIVVGAIIGALARLVLPGKQELGILATVVVGWIGSLLGGILGRRVLHVGTFLTILVEIAVAAVLVAIASGGVGNAVARRNSSLRY